jgi:hypothetical protein
VLTRLLCVGKPLSATPATQTLATTTEQSLAWEPSPQASKPQPVRTRVTSSAASASVASVDHCRSRLRSFLRDPGTRPTPSTASAGEPQLITAGLSSTPPLGTRSTPPAAPDGEPQLTTASPSAASPSRMRPTPSTPVHGGPQLPTAVHNGNAPAAPASATSKPASGVNQLDFNELLSLEEHADVDNLQLRNERRCLVCKLEADREVLRGRLDARSRSGADPLAQTQQATGTGHPEAKRRQQGTDDAKPSGNGAHRTSHVDP